MTDEQIGQLKDALDDGNNGHVYWMPDENTARRVICIRQAPPPKEGDEPEPVEVAFFLDGKYAALDVAEFGEFKLVRPVADLFE